MLIRKDPLVSDVTIVNDVRAVLYEALSRREEIVHKNKLKLADLSTWKMGLRALERLHRFFTVAQLSRCAFAYPTILYLPAKENVEANGFHFSAPPLLSMVSNFQCVDPNQRTVRLKIPILGITGSDSENAARVLADSIPEEGSSALNRLLGEIRKLAIRTDREYGWNAKPFRDWHKSNLISIHTHAVANTSWDEDPSQCTALQREFVNQKLKLRVEDETTPHEIIPRGIVYLMAAMQKGMGLCHSVSRDHVLRFVSRKSWVRAFEDALYSLKPLETRFSETLLLILKMATPKDAKRAAYCRELAPVGSNGKVKYGSIKQETVQASVNSWETQAWRVLLTEILVRTDLRQNRIKTLAQVGGPHILARVAEEGVRMSLTPANMVALVALTTGQPGN
jgi:hypothetical protein